MTTRTNAAIRSRTARQLARNAFKRAELGVFCSRHEPVIEAMAAAIERRLIREEKLQKHIRWYEKRLTEIG